VLSQEYALAPLVLALWRNIFAVLTVGIALRIFKPRLLRLDWADVPYIVAHGLVLALFNALWTLSVFHNGAAVATVLVYSSAAFAAVFGLLWLKEDLDLTKALVIVLSLAGCMLVAGVTSVKFLYTNLLGLALGISSGLSYALYSIFGRGAAKRRLSPWTTLLYSFTAAALWLLLLNLMPSLTQWGAGGSISRLLWSSGTLKGWLVLFTLAAGPTVLGFGLYNISLIYLPASTVNLIAVVEPVFTSIVALMVLGETLKDVQIFGGALVLVAVAFLHKAEARKHTALGGTA